MKSVKAGKNTLTVEVTNISQHGVWLFLEETEYFLSYEKFPWFKDANVSDIHNVMLLNKNHLYWKVLDVDLHLESIKAPELYPLVAR